MTHWVLVTGARDYPDMETVDTAVTAALSKSSDSVLVHGNARGVDRRAKDVATRLHRIDKPYSYRGEFGKAGGPIRNQEMVDWIVFILKQTPTDTAEALSFPLIPINPKSGTRDCMARIYKAGIPLTSYPCSGPIGLDD